MQLKEIETDHNSSLLLKPSPNVELLVNQFNNVTPENNSDPGNFIRLNIMTSMKCITLQYLRRINHCAYSNISACSLNKNLIKFNIF